MPKGRAAQTEFVAPQMRADNLYILVCQEAEDAGPLMWHQCACATPPSTACMLHFDVRWSGNGITLVNWLAVASST